MSENYNDSYYQKVRVALSIKRKQKYQEDAEYREKVKARSREYKRNNPTSRSVLVIPDEYTRSLPEAALELDVKTATLREWLAKEYFPRPKQFGPNFRLKDHQFELLAKLATHIATHGGRLGTQTPQFEALKAEIHANWE